MDGIVGASFSDYFFDCRKWLDFVTNGGLWFSFSLWPTAAVLVKRLHDRNKSGWWALLVVVAWMLAAGNWSMLAEIWQWGVGRFIPTLIGVMMLIDCGSFIGTEGDNRFGPEPTPVDFKNAGR